MFFCIQETQISNPTVFNTFANAWCGPCFSSPTIGKQFGVLVCINESFHGTVKTWKKDTSGRIISLLIDFDGFNINLLNIYAPTNLTERKVFFETLHEFFLHSESRIIAGDFNCYEHQLDKFGGNFVPFTYLSDLRSAFLLCDAWRHLHPHLRQCKWFNFDFSIGSRLDKFFVSNSLMSSIISCEISPCVFSEHDLICLSIRPDGNNSDGPGLWKFNSSLLSDSTFTEYITHSIRDLADHIEHFPSVKSWWDFFKTSIKSDIISFFKHKRRDLSRDRVHLVNDIIDLKLRLSAGDASVTGHLFDLESQLKALTLRDLEGCKVRSRVLWFEEGQKPTRYFFKFERERVDCNTVTSIFNSGGMEVFSRAEIEQVHVQFYTSLFSADPIDPVYTQRCLDCITRSLSPALRATCARGLYL